MIIGETLYARLTVLSNDIVTDAVCSGARILRTPREVNRTGRDAITPRDGNAPVAAARSNSPVQNFHSTTNPLSRNSNQEIINPIGPVSPQWIRNSEKLKNSINGFLHKIEFLKSFLVS